MSSAVLTTRVSDEMLASLDELARLRKRSRAWIVSDLLVEAVKKDLAFWRSIQEGLDDLEAGRSISQEEMEAWFDARMANRASRIAAE